MKTINDFITSLFLGVKDTEKTRQLKEDLLANAEDRYDDLKEQGKSENEAIGAVISEFGNIDELLNEMDLKQEYEDEFGQEINEITVEDIDVYFKVQHKGATLIGSGVTAILIGIGLFFGIQVFSTMFLGLLLLFMSIAIGVPLFIIAGTSMVNENQKLNDRLIPIIVKKEAQKRKEAFQRSFVLCMVFGVALCILSVFPLISSMFKFGSEGAAEKYRLLGLCCMMILLSIAVFFFILGGVVMGSFTKVINENYFISDEDKMGPNARADLAKKQAPILIILEKIYWPIVLIIYLGQSFILGNWATSWIIFPIAGILFGVLESMFKKE